MRFDPESGLILPRSRRDVERGCFMGAPQQALLMAGAGGGGSSDPYFSNVIMLLAGQGTNGSAITDTSSYAHSLSILYGSPVISTAQSYFGGSSCYFPGGAVLCDSADPNNLYDYTDNATPDDAMTIEVFVRFESTAADPQFIVDNRNTGGTASWAVAKESGKLGIFLGGTGWFYASATSISAGTWYHLAFSKAEGGSTPWYGYLDGVNGFSQAAQIAGPYSRVGGRGGGDFTFNGWLHLRWTRGVDRYPGGTTFTPPTTFI